MYNGGTKQGELDRSAELFTQILEERGAYFALMFLLDSGYGREEIAAIANRLKKRSPMLVAECEANAALIAAAPDLLAAVKALEFAYDRGEESGSVNWDDLDHAYRLALAALKRIEGRE